MLSKEKSVPHNQESLKQNELITSIPQKKPHYRYVDYDRLSRTKHVRVKFWKFHSCNLSNFDSELEKKMTMGLEEMRKENQKKKEFEKTLNHSTIRKSFKFIKRVKWSYSLLPFKNRLFDLCKSWKLETLNFSVIPNYGPGKLLKAFLNSKLKDCFLIFGSNSTICDLDPRLISSFRRLKKSLLFVTCIKSFNNMKIFFDTDKLLPYHKSRQFTPPMHRDGFKFITNQVIVNNPNSFQKISYQCIEDHSRGIFVLPDLPLLPSLQDLRFSRIFFTPSQELVDMSFMKQYSKLKSLSIQLNFGDPKTLDFLTDLPCLKEFNFSSERGQIRDLPNLTKLEKISLCINDPIIFSTENIRDFILKNKSLEDLELSLSIQNLGNILNYEDKNVSFPPIKQFRFKILSSEEPETETAANRIIAILKKLDSLKQLSIEFQKSSPQLNTIFFKEGFKSLKFLESFTLKYCSLAKLEGNNFGHLKDVFATLENLKTIDIDFGQDLIGPQEISLIVDGLFLFKHLEKLRFQAGVIQFTSTAYNQLLNFLTSIQHIKSLYFKLKGVSQIDRSRLKKILLPKCPLSQSSFSFTWL